MIIIAQFVWYGILWKGLTSHLIPYRSFWGAHFLMKFQNKTMSRDIAVQCAYYAKELLCENKS